MPGDICLVRTETSSGRCARMSDYRETVPFNEAQPSPDGEFWRCKRADGSRRCFFAPPPTD